MTKTMMFEVGELPFEDWKELVNAEFVRITMGFSSEDLLDWDYAMAFEEGVEPRDAAHRALAQDTQGRGFLALAGINPEEVDP